ncbi:MAG: outer membrane lipoprotein-sorting protein [Myxococcales bacterium]
MTKTTTKTLLALLTLVALPARAELPTAEALLDRMDRNLTFEARRTRMVMKVEGKRPRTYDMVSYGRGEEDAAIEYVAPAREKGTRMLKLGDELWIYLPSVERVQKISGHMLRQGMMGSDVSYEDLMASRELRKMYAASVTGEGEVDGRPCWTLELKAKDDTVSYPRRVSCVDKETYIPLEQKLYALSGMLLKTWSMSDVKAYDGGRRFPSKMVVQDHVKKESVTRIEFTEMEFGIQFPKEIFSLRWLERR